jgi:hypothetical protein
MLMARKPSVWRGRYELLADGRVISVWEPRVWRTAGSFELAGRRYEVTGNAWGTRYTMTDQVGMAVATADRVGRKRWTVSAEGRTYQFQRPSWFRSEERLLSGDQPVGSVRRVSVWRGDTVADLPGLSLPVQVFVLVVVLTMWNAQAAAAAVSAG